MTNNDTVMAPPVPDLLGEQGRQVEIDRTVVQVLRGIQTEIVRLEVLQRLNGDKDDSMIPGEAKSYAERVQELRDTEFRVADLYPETMQRLAAQMG